jgi:hypothetical protein
MSENFLTTLNTELGKHPFLKKLDGKKITALAEAFDSWAEIAAYEVADFLAMFVESETPFTEAEAKALIAKAKSESAGGEHVEMEGHAVLEEKVTSPEDEMFGPYAAMRGGAAMYGMTASSIIGNWSPDNIKAYSVADGAFVADAGGLDTAVFEVVKRRTGLGGSKISDATLRQLMFEYKRKKGGNTGDFLSEDERKQYWKVIGGVLNTQDMELLAACAALFNKRQEALALGPSASIAVGGSKLSISDILARLPQFAVKVDGVVGRGDFVEASNLMAQGEYEAYIWKMLLNPTFQRMCGVIELDENNLQATAFEALTNEGYEEAGRYMLAGLAVQEVFARLAHCTTQPTIQFAMFIGEAASNWLSAASGLDLSGAEEVARAVDVAPFRAPEPTRAAGAARQDQVRTRRWEVNIHLGITRG